MGRVIFITAFKGGVGKTTVSANVSSVLAQMGNKVLAIDGDFGMRCLDMALGFESSNIYNFADVLNGNCKPSDAITQSDKIDGLYFVSSPVNMPSSLPDEKAFRAVLQEFRAKFDYIIVDSSAEETEYYRKLCVCCDDAVVVSFHQSISVRAAEKAGMRLEELGVENIRLVVNNYSKSLADSKKLPSVYEMINSSAIQLLGVIPRDENINTDQENGITAFGTKRKNASPYEAAVYNIACRMTGRSTVLFDGVFKNKKRKHFKYIVDNK